MTTPAQIEANRQNAALSTGPLSPETKAISSMNALKTGLTGRTILLPSDDVAAYQDNVARIERKFDPATDDEKALVQSIADTEWRLLRIPLLEAGIYANGRAEFAGLFPEEADPIQRAGRIDTHISTLRRKELANIHLQETRLQRRIARETAELNRIQEIRLALYWHELELAYEGFQQSKMLQMPLDLTKYGFVFSLDYLKARRRYELYHGPQNVRLFDLSWKANGRKILETAAA